jgi:hypothetical protein
MAESDELPDAVPLCQTWREQNPAPTATGPAPARYCCSAYCDRCAELRRRDGAPVLVPNAWMHQ